jgi:hypothetical protein
MRSSLPTHGDMLIGHISNALKHAAPDRITKVLRRRLGMYIAEVHCSVQAGATGCSHASEHRSTGRSGRHLRVRREGRVREGLEGRRRRLRDEGLRGSNLGSCRGRLLRLRDIGTAVLSIIDTLTSPRGFRGKGGNDLSGWSVSIERQ